MVERLIDLNTDVMDTANLLRHRLEEQERTKAQVQGLPGSPGVEGGVSDGGEGPERQQDARDVHLGTGRASEHTRGEGQPMRPDGERVSLSARGADPEPSDSSVPSRSSGVWENQQLAATTIRAHVPLIHHAADHEHDRRREPPLDQAERGSSLLHQHRNAPIAAPAAGAASASAAMSEPDLSHLSGGLDADRAAGIQPESQEGSRGSVTGEGSACVYQAHTALHSGGVHQVGHNRTEAHSSQGRHSRSVESGLAERAQEDERQRGGGRRAGWWKKTSDWILWGEVEDEEGEKEGGREREGGEGGGVLHAAVAGENVRWENGHASELAVGEGQGYEEMGAFIHPHMIGDGASSMAAKGQRSQVGANGSPTGTRLQFGEHEQETSLRQREFGSTVVVPTPEDLGDEGANKSSHVGTGGLRPLHGAWRAVRGNAQGILSYVVGGE